MKRTKVKKEAMSIKVRRSENGTTMGWGNVGF